MRLKNPATLAVIILLLGACGGGGSSNVRVVGPNLPTISPNSVLISDMIVNGLGYRNERVSNIWCASSFTVCRATYRGSIFEFDVDPDDDADGTIYTTLGRWNHMRAGAILAEADGLEGRYAVVGGVRYPNSLGVVGGAFWRGDMVALDDNNRLVRGDAHLDIDNLRRPNVDVRLFPYNHAPMFWERIPVSACRFEQRWSRSDYIKGEFYGAGAQEVGGVFERNRMIGAFGASRR